MDRARRTEASRCSLCGSALADSPVGTAAGGVSESSHSTASGESSAPRDTTRTFCSTGCQHVFETLDEPDDDATTADQPPHTEDGVDGAAAAEFDDAALERTFLRIDGMHAAMCESYLESVAEATDGVERAAASYVTETVRVDHDPEHVSAAELEDALTTTGYTAYRREEANAGDDSSGGTRRSREMTGLRKRRTDDMLAIRYIVGIVFGSFLLVPYAALLYPAYLASVVDWGMLHLYEDAFTSFDGLLFLPLFLTVTGAVLYLAGMPLLRGAYISLARRRSSTHLLAALTVVSAFCYGTIAFVAGRNDVYFDLTVLVAAAVMGATFYEATIKRRAMDRLTELTVSQVDTARVYDPDEGTRETPVGDLTAGDRLLVRAGERIPVDGELVESSCTVDEAVVTGESLPVSKTPGDEVIGGSVVTSDAAIVDVGDRTASSIDRLTRVVWNLQSADHGIQRRADDLAAVFAPAVLVAAVVVGLVTVARGGDSTATALAVLLTVVVASPWALGLATPCSVASSIRDALARGIVVFDETVFERLRDVDVVVFDKTGTLTTGEMTVLEADAPDDLLRAAGELERHAAHPAAAAITDAFEPGGPDPDSPDDDTSSARDDESGPAHPDGGAVDESESEVARESGADLVREFTAHETGVSGVVDGDRVLVGHPDLFADRGWRIADALGARASRVREAGRLPVVVGRNGRAEGLVVVGDEPRDGWDETITALSETGVDVVVLTGDQGSAANAFGRHAGVEHVFAGVPPDGKTAAIRRLRADNRVAMVGDGTNDAPALAEADLGISLGSGTALASDAADLAIVDDDLGGVDRAFALATAARRRVVQNLALALGYNAIVIPIAAAGLLNPLFTTVAVAITGGLVVLNSSRSLLPASR